MKPFPALLIVLVIHVPGLILWLAGFHQLIVKLALLRAQQLPPDDWKLSDYQQVGAYLGATLTGYLMVGFSQALRSDPAYRVPSSQIALKMAEDWLIQALIAVVAVGSFPAFFDIWLGQSHSFPLFVPLAAAGLGLAILAVGIRRCRSQQTHPPAEDLPEIHPPFPPG